MASLSSDCPIVKTAIFTGFIDLDLSCEHSFETNTVTVKATHSSCQISS